MSKRHFAMPVSLALIAGAASPLAAQDSETVEVPTASEFSPVQRYNIAYDERRDLAEFYLRDYGFKLRHADIQLADHPDDSSMRVMLVTVDGIQNNAVSAVQWRFGIQAYAGRWQATEAGIRRKCNRGPDAGEWTRDVCP